MFGWLKAEAPTSAQDDVAGEFFRACNIYCHPDTNQVIVAAVYNHGGLMAEKPGGTTIVNLGESAALHEAVRAALAACEYKKHFNYIDAKPSDWPAYQASRFKTMKRFEAEYVRLLVKGVNEKNLFYAVTTPEFGQFAMHLDITVNALTGNYAEAIQYILRNYVICKSVALP